MEKLSLYIHIPFCRKKCAYCDFLSGPASAQEQKHYVEALCRQIRKEGDQIGKNPEVYYVVDTVFFGGGTPSLLEEGEMIQVMDALRESFSLEPHAEISLELNPGTVNRHKLALYQQLGINRLSIGLQSMDDEQLKELGRIHTKEVFLQTWFEIRNLGFGNVNVDLMAALPGQSVESYETTLREVIGLSPEHISAYSLILEEGTPFFERFSPGKAEEKRLPTEEEDRQMYELTGSLLQQAGYERYEISNYSKPGYACQHNLGYWKGKEYLGLGLGASSYLRKKRFHQETELSAYIRKIHGDESAVVWEQQIGKKEQMEEFMYLGLRCTEGICPQEFWRRFSLDIDSVYGRQVKKLIQDGLLEITKGGRIALTELGLDLSNQVFAAFI